MGEERKEPLSTRIQRSVLIMNAIGAAMNGGSTFQLSGRRSWT